MIPCSAPSSPPPYMTIIRETIILIVRERHRRLIVATNHINILSIFVEIEHFLSELQERIGSNDIILNDNDIFILTENPADCLTLCDFTAFISFVVAVMLLARLVYIVLHNGADFPYYCIFALLVGSCAITSKVHILRL